MLMIYQIILFLVIFVLTKPDIKANKFKKVLNTIQIVLTIKCTYCYFEIFQENKIILHKILHFYIYFKFFKYMFYDLIFINVH